MIPKEEMVGFWCVEQCIFWQWSDFDEQRCEIDFKPDLFSLWENTKELEPEFARVIDKYFWDLV